MSTISTPFLKKIKEAQEENLKKLDLSGVIGDYRNQLTKIPGEVFQLEHLEILNLSHNKLTVIPDSISRLQNLTSLDLRFNRLTTVPDSISKLRNLTSLDLSVNRLTTVPGSISQLQNLTELYLSSNQLRIVPDSICQLKHLEGLYLSDNQLTSVPESISQLENLTGLFLFENHFISIPDVIYKLRSLKELFFSSNEIKEISRGVLQLKNLEELKLDNNPIESPPPEVVKKGVDAIKDYFRQLEAESKDYSGGILSSVPTGRTEVFISYSHKDKEWLLRVQTHLRTLKMRKIDVEVWDDTRIKAGAKWKQEIKIALDETKIAILLISTDFLASDFIVKNELPPLLEAAKRNGAVILPLILKPSIFTRHEKLSEFQAINDPDRPLIKLEEADQEEILVKLTSIIEENL